MWIESRMAAWTDNGIARRLGITVATAWKHTESIAFKLGVYRRDALVQRLRDIAAGKGR